MKKTKPILNVACFIAFSLAVIIPEAARAYQMPERFGVIDVIPTNYSGEMFQNSEPSIAVGTLASYQQFLIHAFNDNAVDWIYGCQSQTALGLPWGVPDEVLDVD